MEAYDKAIGPNDLKLVKQAIPKSKEFFAEGRYPKRHRLPTSCFWKNERAIYQNTGDGIEIVGFQCEENSNMMTDDHHRSPDLKGKIKVGYFSILSGKFL